MRVTPIAPVAAALLAAALAFACEEGPPPPLGPDTCAQARVSLPAHPFDPERLAARRAALMDEIGTGVAILVAGWHPPESPLRQESNFHHLTGLDVRDVWLVLVARDDGPDEEILYVGPQAGGAPASSASEVTGIADVRCLDGDAYPELHELLHGAGSPAAAGVYTTPTDDALRERVDLTGLTVVTITPARFEHRAIKDEQEVARLRRAARVSVAGLRAGMAAVGPGRFEGDVRGVIEDVYADSGAARTAFRSIVASGGNTLTLHYFDAADTMRAGDLVIIDVGAEHARYAGDVARTVPVSGMFTEEQRAIYEVVLAARDAALSTLAAGGTPAQAEMAAQDAYASHWETCGVDCNDHVRHLLYHAVGLDVHDGRYPRFENAWGVVLNVEPGLYFEFRGFGMRVEDTILLTGSGYELLSEGLPTTVAEIEAFMAAN